MYFTDFHGNAGEVSQQNPADVQERGDRWGAPVVAPSGPHFTAAFGRR